MIEISNLSVIFGDFTAVDNISFKVKRGEIFGLLGANGAGKTTTIRVMCGLLNPTVGEIKIGETIFGKDNQPPDKIKSQIGYMSQKFTLYDDLTVDENWEFAAAIRNISKHELKLRSAYLKKWPTLNNLPSKKLVGTLPSGIKQQVALASALLHNPDIIFLDEPTAGVSPYARKQFWDLIKTLAGDGKTIIVTTHYMDEAENCDRIALMRSGEIIALESPSVLKHKTFPHGIWAINENLISPDLKLDLEIKKREGIIKTWPCGINVHLISKDPSNWNMLLQKYPILSKANFIDPSLEDVFLELVEGINR